MCRETCAHAAVLGTRENLALRVEHHRCGGVVVWRVPCPFSAQIGAVNLLVHVVVCVVLHFRIDFSAGTTLASSSEKGVCVWYQSNESEWTGDLTR